MEGGGERESETEKGGARKERREGKGEDIRKGSKERQKEKGKREEDEEGKSEKTRRERRIGGRKKK